MPLAIANTEIVQTCGNFHETIRAVRQGIAQSILNTPRSFDPCNSMFDADADPRESAIVRVHQKAGDRLTTEVCNATSCLSSHYLRYTCLPEFLMHSL